MFQMSDHLSVNQFFAIDGLRKLASLTADVDAAFSESVQKDADALMDAVTTHTWNETTGRFCDGACIDAPHHGVTTNAWGLYLNVVPNERVADTCADVAAWGNDGFGMYVRRVDIPQKGRGEAAAATRTVLRRRREFVATGARRYGVFIYLSALAACDVDDGTAMLTALTKCDDQSWCGELDVATMTRENWVGGTYSHPWGTGALQGIGAGVMGIRQTAPAWATYTVKPKLGNLTFANILVPTSAGPIAVNATPSSTIVSVPPNTRAEICVRGVAATLDGIAVDAHISNGYACVGAGNGADGAPRVVVSV